MTINDVANSYYSVIRSNYGNGRCAISILSGGNVIDVVGIIRGAIRDIELNDGDIILAVGDENDNEYDIVYKYQPDQIQTLINSGALEGLNINTDDDMKDIEPNNNRPQITASKKKRLNRMINKQSKAIRNANRNLRQKQLYYDDSE